ncbi:MAG: hypothetical protein IKP62_11160 [Salinivirgaceae bacterium]|nr:hypothetical protein [Salinivirgaceae bacterium]
MKKFLMTIAAAAMCMTVAAQESNFSAAPADGYRGFAGLNVFTGLGDQPFDRFAVTTVHGFQADQLFIGIGASMQFVTNSNSESGYYDETGDYHYYSYDEELEFVMPFFINANYEFSSGRIAPFADLKLGYVVGDANGLYVLPSVGVRLSHISLWCGYNLMQDKKITGRDNTKTLTNYNSIAFGVTLDWGRRK